MKNGGTRRFRVPAEVGDFVEQFNLARIWHWFGLAGLVGVVAGLASLIFHWFTQSGILLFWGYLIGWAPVGPGGERLPLSTPGGEPRMVMLVLVPAVGALLASLLVRRFAPEAAGSGSNQIVHAYHQERGQVRRRVAWVKLLASALTVSSGGSAGREGPIAQIGGSLGSMVGRWFKLSERDRRILVMVGVAAGIGAIFRAPLAGALFASEVLYSEPDIESEVVIPALISSMVAYSIYCAVHGYGHLFTGTETFVFEDPVSLLPYLALGIFVAFGAIAFVVVLESTTRFFGRLPIPELFRPVLGAALTGGIGLLLWKGTGDLDALGVMGSGYGILQKAMSATDTIGPSMLVLGLVAVGKILTTSLTIGSGGSGGVFGPSVVIGGMLGALVGTVFHMIWPSVVPEVGPFVIVGMAGFFGGAANTPISTLLMVGDLTGNYSLLIPSMLVVAISLVLGHRWTIYPDQVRTRADSPAHRGEFMMDVLADLRVEEVFLREREVHTVHPDTPLSKITELVISTHQQYFPVVDEAEKVVGIFSLNDLRETLYEEALAGLVVAQDIATIDVLSVSPRDDLGRALQLLTVKNIGELPVIEEETSRLLGILSRRDIIAAYHRRLAQIERP